MSPYVESELFIAFLFQRDSRNLVPAAVNSTAAFGELIEHGRDPQGLCGRFEKMFLILCGVALACLLEAFARAFTKMICIVHGAALCPTLSYQTQNRRPVFHLYDFERQFSRIQRHVEHQSSRGAVGRPVQTGRALAMTTAKRSPLLPGVPTLSETGIGDFDITSWYGMMAPHALPVRIRDAIFSVTNETLATPDPQKKLSAQGLSVTVEPPDEFAARIKRETALWASVIKAQHITAQ